MDVLLRSGSHYPDLVKNAQGRVVSLEARRLESEPYPSQRDEQLVAAQALGKLVGGW